MFGWLSDLRARRREQKERDYWALREAEAMRMQHGRKAEQVCETILSVPEIPFRKRRFMTLVRKHLAHV
jgi:hypothetical protein